MRFLPALLLFLVASPVLAEDIDVATTRGVKLKATLHVPKSGNGTAVVIAPGGGYHKDLPLITTCADHLQKAGFVVLRFNWGYFTAQKRPSAGLANEQADLDAAIAFLKARKDVKRILVAGKSLGSFVTVLRVAKRSDDVSGVALLTFPLHPPGQPDKPQREANELKKIKLPTLIVSGNADPLCSLKSLYTFVTTLPAPPEIVITPGNHGLEEKNKKKSKENIDLAARALTIWAKRQVP